MANNPLRCQRASVVFTDTRCRSAPSLTALLVRELCLVFLAAPLAAKGLPMARAVADMLVLGVLAIVVMLSQKWRAIIWILLGPAATGASVPLSRDWSPVYWLFRGKLRKGYG